MTTIHISGQTLCLFAQDILGDTWPQDHVLVDNVHNEIADAISLPNTTICNACLSRYLRRIDSQLSNDELHTLWVEWRLFQCTPPQPAYPSALEKILRAHGLDPFDDAVFADLSHF